MTVKKGMFLNMVGGLDCKLELAALPQVLALQAANVEYSRMLDMVQAENAEYRRKLDEEQARRWQRNGEKLAAYKANSKPMPQWQFVIAACWMLLCKAWDSILNWGKRT